MLAVVEVVAEDEADGGTPDGQVKGRYAIRRHRMHIGAVLKQQPHHKIIPTKGCVVKGRVLWWVSRRGVKKHARTSV